MTILQKNEYDLAILISEEKPTMLEWIYEKNNNNTARFILGTKGINPLVCFGVNPSNASPEQLDNTIRSIQRISFGNGFDSWIMLNVYPQRATKPNDLDIVLNNEFHRENISFINGILLKNTRVFAAWGNVIGIRTYLKYCAREIFEVSKRNNCRWFKFGESTKLCHPRHPLYLKKKIDIQEFDSEEYILKHFI